MSIQAIFVSSISIAVLIILLIGLFLNNNRKAEKSKRLRFLIYSTIVFLLANIACDLVDQKEQFNIVNYIASFLTYVSIDAIVLSFAFYQSSLLKEKNYRYPVMIKIIFITCVLRIVVSTILLATKNLFIIDKGVYKETNLAIIAYILAAIEVIELIFVSLSNIKNFSKKQITVVLLYEIMPMVPIVLEFTLGIYALTGPTITLSILLIYVLLQDTTLEQSEMQQKKFEILSKTDQLTGLLNRRAYYEHISNLNKTSSLGVIFCDVNGLKIANDRYGHAAGDNLLISFADLLQNRFKNQSIYRISGDEFVVIYEQVYKENFIREVNVLISEVRSKNNMASVGSAFGKAPDFDRLINQAEKAMYEDKAEFGLKR